MTPPDLAVTADQPVVAGRRRPGRGPGPVVPAVVVALALLVGAAGAGRWFLGRDQESRWVPPSGQDTDPAGPLVAGDDPTRGSVRFAASGGVVAGPEVELVVEAPPGVDEMQVGTDPTFADTPWTPLPADPAGGAVLSIHDTGYQMLFARFRGPGGEPGGISVDGVTVDPTWEAAVSGADGVQEASWVRPLGDRTLMVRVEGGRLERGAQEAYDVVAPPDGDELGTDAEGRRQVIRHGEPYGLLVPGHDDLVRPYDVIRGRPVDGDALTSGTWRVTTGSGRILTVAAVERISRPRGDGLGPDGAWLVPVVHDVVLTLDDPVPRDEPLTVEPPDGLVAPIGVTIDPDRTVSPLVHVNQNGFAPGDSLKVGYVGGLFGAVGGLDQLDLDARPFRVIDVVGGTVALEATATVRPGGDELGHGDLTGATTWELDFSPLTEPGRYRLCVDDVGCSEDFDIDAGVWRRLAVQVARSLYHQRSGVSLGPPFTAIQRPRPYHPDDGMRITESDLTWVEAANGTDGNWFPALAGADTGEPVAQAWGGHFDAGDWDRNVLHLTMVRTLAGLVEDDPDLWADLDLDLPESGDDVPDLLDEALWTLDLFRRLQRDDGAVPGGVEASEHPAEASTSWTEDLAVYTFAPDPLGTFVYAATAAEVAAVLEPYDADRAADYLASAERAMTWATDQDPTGVDGLDPDGAAHLADQVTAARQVADLSLFKAGGDPARLEEFETITGMADGVDAELSCHDYGRCQAAWTYLTLDPSVTDPRLRVAAEDSIVATADDILAGAETTTYGFTTENRFVPLIWGLGAGGTPKVTALLRAHQVTGDPRYREAALRSASYSLGANPLNVSYITGVGTQPVAEPLLVDHLYGGLPVWPGTPVYGNHTMGEGESWVDQYLLGPAGVTPPGADLPYLWQWFDVSHVAQFNEYTVHQGHGPSIYAFGTLASTSGTSD